MSKERAYYPVFIDITDKRCVVFGGGQVALRKVKMLLDFSAKVDVIAPEICDELTSMAESGEARVVRRAYQQGDLKGVFVAIAATDDNKTNEKIAQEGSERNVMVNVVDVPDLCDFIVPSYVKRGELVLAISTGGASPALARKLRTKLEREFGEEYAALVRIVGEVRDEMRSKGLRADGDAWQAALDIDSLLNLLRQGRVQEVKARLLENLKKNEKAGK